MTFVVGVDGGGTHTRVVLLDGSGAEIGRGSAPGAVLTPTTEDVVVHSINEATTAGLAVAGLSGPADALWAGLAGAGREESRVRVTDALRAGGLADRVEVVTDAEAAFQAAFGEAHGILLIAGTGSIALGRDPTGRSLRVGGWGQRLGDEGSGFWIGIAALRAVLMAEDGRAPPTALRTVVFEAVGVAEVEALVPWKDAASKADVAGLAPLVVQAAGEGDQTAAAILDEAAAELERHVTAMLESSHAWPPTVPLAAWGGLIAQGGPLRARMERVLEPLRVRLAHTEIDPAAGAARMALASLAR